MLILKHLKTLQHVSIIIQIIIRDFVGSLFKSLNLKFNCQQLNVVMQQHNVWCKCVTSHRKFKFHYNCTRIMNTLHEDRYTFLIISH